MDGRDFFDLSACRSNIKKERNQINHNMQICNESTEEERVDNIEKESADSEENREAKQLPY